MQNLNPRLLLVIGSLTVIVIALFLSSEDIPRVNNLAQVSSSTPSSGILFQDTFIGGKKAPSQNGVSWGAMSTGQGSAISVIPDAGNSSGFALGMTYGAASSLSGDGWAEQRFKLPKLTEAYFCMVWAVPANYFHRSVSPANNKILRLWDEQYNPSYVHIGMSVLPRADGTSQMIVEFTNSILGGTGNFSTGPWNLAFVPNSEQSVLFYAKVASAVGASDGTIRVWWNGNKVYDRSDLPIHRDGGTATGGNYFENGYLPGWANSGFAATTTLNLRKFVVSQTPISCSSTGTTPPPPAPTLSLSSSPSSITSGQSSTITWSTTNAVSCTATGGWSGAKSTSGSQVVNPTVSTSYNLSCTGTGGTVTQGTTVTVGSPPTGAPTLSISASPSSITSGGSSTITWSSTNTTSCNASNGWTGTKTTSGTQSVSPTSNTTYNLSCTGTGGTTAQSTSVSVTSVPPPPPTALFQIGDYVKTTSTLNVRSSGSINASLLGSQVGNSYGTVIGGPVIDGTYIWWQIDYVNAPDGWSSQTYLTEVTSLPTPPTGAPTLSISASPSSITSGGSSTITWSSTNTTSCNASNGWTGTKTTSGTQSVSPTSNTTYNLSCTGTGGTTAQSTSVSVTTPPPPTGNYSIGNWIEISTDKLNVRTGPSTLSGKAGFQYQGAKGILTNGPTSADGYTWWYVDFSSGSDGWAADSFFTLSSAPTPITTGSTVYTTERINVRSLPSTTSTRVGQQSANRPGTVIGGPTSAEGYTWWNVDFLSGADGWVAGEWLR